MRRVCYFDDTEENELTALLKRALLFCRFGRGHETDGPMRRVKRQKQEASNNAFPIIATVVLTAAATLDTTRYATRRRRVTTAQVVCGKILVTYVLYFVSAIGSTDASKTQSQA